MAFLAFIDALLVATSLAQTPVQVATAAGATASTQAPAPATVQAPAAAVATVPATVPVAVSPVAATAPVAVVAAPIAAAPVAVAPMVATPATAVPAVVAVPTEAQMRALAIRRNVRLNRLGAASVTLENSAAALFGGNDRGAVEIARLEEELAALTTEAFQDGSTVEGTTTHRARLATRDALRAWNTENGREALGFARAAVEQLREAERQLTSLQAATPPLLWGD